MMAPLPSVAVIIPTIAGREEHFARCVTGYEVHAPGSYDLELIVEHDHPTCGSAWQAGAERATADYLHFTCDDIEPQAGWAQPAVETLAEGFLPAPRVLNGTTGAAEYQPAWGSESPDWTPVHMSALPFISRDLWENHVRPMLTCHYYCVVPETPVLTAGLEWVPAGKLGIGDVLVAVDEFPAPYGDRRWRRAVVTGAGRRILECVTLRLEDGREVTCSADHAWLVKTWRKPDIPGPKQNHLSWIRAERLLPGDLIVSPFACPWQQETSFEAGWLAGIFDGEGSAGRYGKTRSYKSTALSVAQNPGPVLDRIKVGLDAMGIRYSEAPNASNSNVTKLRIRTLTGVLELLGRLQPVRLSPDSLWEGASIRSKAPDQYATVGEIRPAGMREVAALGTSTGTFLANGMVSHNTDDWISWRSARAGYQSRVRRDYLFRHYWAQHKRGAGMSYEARMWNDHSLYQQAMGMVLEGRWDRPWPIVP